MTEYQEEKDQEQGEKDQEQREKDQEQGEKDQEQGDKDQEQGEKDQEQGEKISRVWRKKINIQENNGKVNTSERKYVQAEPYSEENRT